jgi:hypothetical protein
VGTGRRDLGNAESCATGDRQRVSSEVVAAVGNYTPPLRVKNLEASCATSSRLEVSWLLSEVGISLRASMNQRPANC